MLTVSPQRIRFALYRFRSPLITVSIFLSFPPLTKMLQFRGFPFLSEQSEDYEVAFGNLRIKGCLRLPSAYHSLPCPSSAREPSHPLYGIVTNTPSIARGVLVIGDGY